MWSQSKMSIIGDINTGCLGLNAFADLVKKLTLKQNVKLIFN